MSIALKNRKHITFDDVFFAITDNFLTVFGALVILAAIVAGGLWVVNLINAPSSGTIHNEEYTPAHSTVDCYTVNKQTSCYPVWVPASYKFDLYNENGKHGWVNVDEYAYDHHHVGDFYNTKG